MKKSCKEELNQKSKKISLRFKCKMHQEERINIKTSYNNMKEKQKD